MAACDVLSFRPGLFSPVGTARGRCNAITAWQGGLPIVLQTSLYLKTMVSV